MIYLLTDEQVEELKQNPYVRRVSNKTICYTDEFREIFLKEYLEGIPPSQILRKLGFDPKVLGKKRISGLAERCRKIANDNHLEDHHTRQLKHPKKDMENLKAQIAELEHTIELQKQEIASLKKQLDKKKNKKDKKKKEK